MTFGLCAADTLCRAYDKINLTPEDAEDHLLGPACLRAGVFAVDSLPRDWRDLEQLLPPSLGVWSDGQPRGKDGPPIPMNLGVEALQKAIWWVATAWEEVVREQDRLSDVPLRVREGPAVVRASSVLSVRVGLLSDLPPVVFAGYHGVEEESFRTGGISWTSRWGWQGVMDLVRLHSRASSVLGLTSPVRRLPGSCQACGRDELRQDQPKQKGDEQPVYCSFCALVMTYDDYKREMAVWV